MSTVQSRKASLAEQIWNGEVTPGVIPSTAGGPLNINGMKDAVVRLFDEANMQNFDVFDEMLAPEFISYGGAGFQDLIGPGAFRQLYVDFVSSLPDLNFRVDLVVAEGNLVAVRGTLSGTHQGNFMGFAPPTGKFVLWTGTAILRFDQNGLMDRRWQEWDGLSVMQQMGVIPTQPTAGAKLPDPIPPHVVGGSYTSPNQNKATMRRLMDEVWNGGRQAVADEIYHPRATCPSNPSLPLGGAGARAMVDMYRQAMPDFHVEFKELLADGDMVMAWISQSGTQNGALMGLPATGKKATWGQIINARFAGGQIVESWTNEDVLGLMQQLGVGGSVSSGA